MGDFTALNLEAHERRRYGRISNDLDIDLVLVSGKHAGDQVTGQLLNISREGLGTLLKSEVQPGTRVDVAIYSDEEQSWGSGEVIWRNEVHGKTVHGIKIFQWSHLQKEIEDQLPPS